MTAGLMRLARYAAFTMFLLLVGAIGQQMDDERMRDEPGRWTP